MGEDGTESSNGNGSGPRKVNGSETKQTPPPAKRKSKPYDRRPHESEHRRTIERQRREAKLALVKVGIFQLVDDCKEIMKQKGDTSAAIDTGIIPEEGGDLYVMALRWELEELKSGQNVYKSKALRVIFDSATASATVSYIAKNDAGDLEWVEDGDPQFISDSLKPDFSGTGLNDIIADAIEMATDKTIDDRTIVKERITSNPPGIGKDSFE